MEPVTDVTSHARLRAFLEGDDVVGRRVTAEWLAGRLGVPVSTCSLGLDQLATEGFVRRHSRADSAPWFDVVPPPSGVEVRRLGLGALVLGASGAVVFTGAMLNHVFYFALGLGLGLMIAFAWLDWELRTRI